MSSRKINTKQLTKNTPIIKHGKKQFYFRYYCPDLKKDNARKFVPTEAEARLFREQIKEKQVLGPSAPLSGNISLGLERKLVEAQFPMQKANWFFFST